MSELIIVDNKKDNKQAEARHAITPIFVFKSLSRKKYNNRKN